MSFFELPLELRSQIYSHICIPRSVPFSDYRGFYLSCKRIKHEIEQEGKRFLGKYLTSLHEGLEAWHSDYNVRYTVPTDFLSMHHLRVSRKFDRGVRSCTHSDSIRFIFHMQPFLQLHLASITISLKHERWYIANQMVRIAFPIRWNAAQIVLILPKATSEEAVSIVSSISDWKKHGAKYELEMSYWPRWILPTQQGHNVRVVWTPWRAEEVDEKKLIRALQWL
jgi:hypothetical protein